MTNSVLVTGATGFLGAFVTAELQRQTGATIYCLVRGRSDAGGEYAELSANIAYLTAAGLLPILSLSPGTQ